MSVTVHDIAKRLGKSPQVVSAVLNGGRSRSAASGATRDAIRRLAVELGYRPNTAAQAIATGRFAAVGLVFADGGCPAGGFTALLRGIQLALDARHWQLRLSQAADDVVPPALRTLDVDGYLVLFFGATRRGLDESLTLPQVWINRRRSADCVLPDTSGGGARLAHLLIAAGHRHIAYVDFAAPTAEGNQDGCAGAVATAKAAGLTLRIPLTKPVAPLAEQAALHALLSTADRPRALICAGAREAQAALYAACGLGLAIPRQLSLAVIHHEGLVFAGTALTTACLPWAALGETAVSELAARMNDAAPRAPCALPCVISVGTTVAPP